MPAGRAPSRSARARTAARSPQRAFTSTFRIGAVLPQLPAAVLRPRAMAFAPWVHPVAGLAATALAAYQASLGLRSRRRRPDAPAARRRHAAVGPWLWALYALNWLAGIATVRWARPEIETAASGHFSLAGAIVALLTLGAVLSRWVPVDARARVIHPVIGAAVLVLSGVQVFLGLQL